MAVAVHQHAVPSVALVRKLRIVSALFRVDVPLGSCAVAIQVAIHEEGFAPLEHAGTNLELLEYIEYSYIEAAGQPYLYITIIRIIHAVCLVLYSYIYCMLYMSSISRY